MYRFCQQSRNIIVKTGPDSDSEQLDSRFGEEINGKDNTQAEMPSKKTIKDISNIPGSVLACESSSETSGKFNLSKIQCPISSVQM